MRQESGEFFSVLIRLRCTSIVDSDLEEVQVLSQELRLESRAITVVTQIRGSGASDDVYQSVKSTWSVSSCDKETSK